jgi:hypothetical protein
MWTIQNNKTRLQNLSFLFLLIISLSSSAQTVTFTSFPRNIQLFVRNKSTNMAIVPIAGTVNASAGYSSVVLQVYKNNQLQNTLPFNLTYTSGTASFNFSIPINAELSKYAFRLLSNTNALLKEATDVTAGDVYIVTGQSNAVVNTSVPQFGNTFIITYTVNDFYNNNYNLGSIGYNFANQVVTEKQIPVLVLNGGEGSKPIHYFLRDDANSYNSITNYGRLLARYTAAGLQKTDVTAIIWYQGETNHLNPKPYYLNFFHQLYSAWKQDYNPSSFYVFQVHSGCGLTIESQIPEAHRQLPNLYLNLEIISTNGALQGTDNCHYSGTNGYNILAARLFDLVNQNIYNSTNTTNIKSPDVKNVYFANSTNTVLKFALYPASDTYTFESGIHTDFKIENSTVTVVSGSISGNIVTLNLSSPITTTNAKLTYLGRLQAVTPYIKNGNGIGMLNFKDIPITPLPTTPIFDPITSLDIAQAGGLPTTDIFGITGTWSPAYSVSNSVYTFTPNAGQSITTPVTVSITYYGLYIANGGQFYLKNSTLFTTSNNITNTHANGQFIIQGGVTWNTPNEFVNGKIKVIEAGNSNVNIGKAARHAPINITTQSNDIVECEYIRATPTGTLEPSIAADYILSDTEYWTVTKTSGASTDVQVNGLQQDPIATYNGTTRTGQFIIVRFNTSTNKWESYANSPGFGAFALAYDNSACFPAGSIGQTVASSIGFSTLARTNSAWISSRKNGYLVLESKTKGLVIPRMPNPETSIIDKREGMIVYDTNDFVLKLYNGTTWITLTQTCK